MEAKSHFEPELRPTRETVNGDRIELRKSLPEAVLAMFGGPPPSDNKPRPAIGPPPDGSDPSIDMGAFANGRMPPIVLRRDPLEAQHQEPANAAILGLCSNGRQPIN
jgi:hypothetical protein